MVENTGKQGSMNTKLFGAIFLGVMGCIILIPALVHFGCEFPTPIIDFDLPQQRQIKITGEACFDVGQPLSYEIWSANQKQKSGPLNFIPSGAYTHMLRFQIFTSPDGNLVGVAETKLSRSETLLLHDFTSGQTWPGSDDPAKEQQKKQNLYRRLKQDNPQMPDVSQ
jgi:hypothetical protein